ARTLIDQEAPQMPFLHAEGGSPAPGAHENTPLPSPVPPMMEEVALPDSAPIPLDRPIGGAHVPSEDTGPVLKQAPEKADKRTDKKSQKAPPSSTAKTIMTERPAGLVPPHQTQPQQKGQPGQAGKKAGFRETAWFKKGEVEQEM